MTVSKIHGSLQNQITRHNVYILAFGILLEKSSPSEHECGQNGEKCEEPLKNTSNHMFLQKCT